MRISDWSSDVCSSDLLDPGIAFPVAPFALVVLLHRGKRQRQPAGIAERAQTQVDPGTDAVHGRLIQQPHQQAAEADEILAVVERARAVGLAGLRIDRKSTRLNSSH